MTDTLLESLADLLVLDPDRLRLFLDSDGIDLVREADQEIAAAKASGAWSKPHFRAVLERAKARAAAAAAAGRVAPAPAESFLANHRELRARLAQVGSKDASVERVLRAMSGLARSFERTMPRTVPEPERRLDVRRDGPRVLATWRGASEGIDVLARAQVVSRDHAEVDARLAGALAEALAEALLRGDDVLPGLVPEGASALGTSYRRLPATFQAIETSNAPGAVRRPVTSGSGGDGAGREAPPPPPPESLLELVEAAVGADLPAASSGRPLVCGAPTKLPVAFGKQRLEPFLVKLSGGGSGATRVVWKRLGTLLTKRMQIAAREDQKVAALLTVNLKELSGIKV